MKDYNETEEYNSIETGNTVYVSGLPGKNDSIINNKYGIVKDIFLHCENGRINYAAQIIIENELYFVNFDYIFLIGKKLNNKDIESIIAYEENAFYHYIIKKNIVDIYPILDENGQYMAICNDSYKRKHVFLFSGLN